jgi:radical SAM protein with 4Fe4S-binding SPASM domain
MNTKQKRKNNNQLAKLWESSSITLAAYAAQRHVPLGGTFELTPRCNLRCKMCYIRLDKSQMELIGREKTAEEWIAVAKEAADAGTLNLLITGGEPLIREDFEEIYTALATMGFIITLNTNAALMTTDLLKLFKKYPPTATNVTLYGASSQTYEKICGSPDGFHKTLHGLDMLSQVPTELEVRTTFIKDNRHELNELRAIANRYTKRFAMTVMVNKAVRGALNNIEDCRLTPSQMFDLTEANEEYYKTINKPTEIALEKNIDTDNYVQVKDYGFDLPPKIITCLAAKSMYWVSWDGKMLPCGSFTSPYTLPFEEGFKPAWERLPLLFEDILLPQQCLKCEYVDGKCSNCPAILQSESGSFEKTSQYICEIAKERSVRYS